MGLVGCQVAVDAPMWCQGSIGDRRGHPLSSAANQIPLLSEGEPTGRAGHAVAGRGASSARCARQSRAKAPRPLRGPPPIHRVRFLFGRPRAAHCPLDRRGVCDSKGFELIRRQRPPCGCCIHQRTMYGDDHNHLAVVRHMLCAQQRRSLCFLFRLRGRSAMSKVLSTAISRNGNGPQIRVVGHNSKALPLLKGELRYAVFRVGRLCAASTNRLACSPLPRCCKTASVLPTATCRFIACTCAILLTRLVVNSSLSMSSSGVGASTGTQLS